MQINQQIEKAKKAFRIFEKILTRRGFNKIGDIRRTSKILYKTKIPCYEYKFIKNKCIYYMNKNKNYLKNKINYKKIR